MLSGAQRGTISVLSARGESRTRTRLPSADFESAASAIPPLGLARSITSPCRLGTKEYLRGTGPYHRRAGTFHSRSAYAVSGSSFVIPTLVQSPQLVLSGP